MFAGLLLYENAPPLEAWTTPENWTSSLYTRSRPDVAGYLQDSHSLLVEADVFNTPSSHHHKSVPLVSDKLRIAFWGRLDNREDLAKQLPLAAPLSETPDVNLVLAGWREWGETLPEKLLGDFALAIVNTENKTVFLARDPMGVKPLYYWPHDQGFIFASTPTALCRLRNVRPTPDIEWIARYIVQRSASYDRTAYNEILKLPGGHTLSAGDGKVTVSRYHQWRDDVPDEFTRDTDRMEAYRAVLEEVMQSQLVSDYPLGAENSGGIDSATITSYLSKYIGEPGDKLHSFGFAVAKDEPSYILEVSQAAKIKHNYIVTSAYGEDQSNSERISEHLEILGYPEEHRNCTFHRPFFEVCERNEIRTLFSGYGGDEVVTNYGNNVYRELVDKGQYRAAIDVMPGNPLTKAMRLAKRTWEDRRNQEHNQRFLPAWEERWGHQLLRADVVDRYDLRLVYMESARYDAPFRRHNDWIINGLLKMPYVPTRLENCTLMAAAFGIEYRWPLWDKRLVQRYLSTPIIERVGPGGQNRYLHRRAITGTVPDRVAWKKSKDMGEVRTSKVGSNASTIEKMKQLDGNLHPILDSLIDGGKWRAQMEKVEAGEIGRGIRHQANSLYWLNIWLNGPLVG